MNVSLTPQLEAYIKQKVAKGMYNSVSEVVREALRLLEERDAMQSMRLEALRKDIHQGLESLDKGQGKPLDTKTIQAKGRRRLTSDDWQWHSNDTVIAGRDSSVVASENRVIASQFLKTNGEGDLEFRITRLRNMV